MKLGRKYRNRLLRLAAFLRTVPSKRFNMHHWVGDDWNGGKDLSCGTTACAMGWASTMPYFRRLGLRLIPARDGGGYPELISKDEILLPGSSWQRQGYYVPMRLFGLTYGDAQGLFSPAYNHGRTPKQVARSIERFVGARA